MQPCDENNNKRQQVINFINQKYGRHGDERINYIYFNNVPTLASREPEISKYF